MPILRTQEECGQERWGPQQKGQAEGRETLTRRPSVMPLMKPKAGEQTGSELAAGERDPPASDCPAGIHLTPLSKRTGNSHQDPRGRERANSPG